MRSMIGIALKTLPRIKRLWRKDGFSSSYWAQQGPWWGPWEDPWYQTPSNNPWSLHRGKERGELEETHVRQANCCSYYWKLCSCSQGSVQQQWRKSTATKGKTLVWPLLKHGHTKDTCWDIYGKPVDWKPQSNGRGSRVNNATTDPPLSPNQTHLAKSS